MLKIEEIRSEVEQVIFAEDMDNKLKSVQLKQIEAEKYKKLISEYAYKKDIESYKILVMIFEDMGYLSSKLYEFTLEGDLDTRLSRSNNQLKFLTDAATFYNYALTIINEKINLLKTDTMYVQKVDTLYSMLDLIKQKMVSSVSIATPLNKDSNSDSFSHSQINTKDKVRENKDKLTKIRTEAKDAVQELALLETGSQDLYVVGGNSLLENITAEMRGFLADLYKEAEKVIGEPPCPYVVMGLGSMALNQMTPYSDLEFAILTNNDEYKSSVNPRVREYFKNLSHLVNFEIVCLGETIIPTTRYELDMSHLVHRGVNFDLGGKTPLGRIEHDKPYELIRTIDGMLHYLRNEDGHASNKDKSLPYMLEKVCYVHGDTGLLQAYQTQATSFLLSTANHPNIEFDSTTIILNCEERALIVLNEGVTEINYSPNTTSMASAVRHFSGDLEKLKPLSGDDGRLFDVKQEIYRLPDRLIYSMGLHYGIEGESAWNTIDQLYEQGIINKNASDHLKQAVTFATTLRVKTYLHNEAQKEDLSLLATKLLTEKKQKEEQSKALHLDTKDLEDGGKLFEYFYIALSLHKKLKEFCNSYNVLDREQKRDFFKDDDFYEESVVNKGLIYYRLGQYHKAQRNLEEALCLQENKNNLQARNALGTIYDNFGNGYGAVEQFTECLRICDNTYPTKIHPDIAGFHSNLGIAYKVLKDYGKAVDSFTQSKSMREAIYAGEPHADVAACINNIAAIYRLQGDASAAIPEFERVLEINTKVHKDKPHPDIAGAKNNLGLCYKDLKEYDRAISYFLEGLDILCRYYHEEPHSYIATILRHLGMTHSARNASNEDLLQAIEYYTKSLQIDDAFYDGASFPNTSDSLNSLGRAYALLEQYDKAIGCYQKCLDVRKSLYGQVHPEIAVCLNNIGSTYREMGDYREAVKYCTKALEMISHFPDDSNCNFIAYVRKKIIEEFLFRCYITSEAPYQEVANLGFTNYKIHYNKAIALQDSVNTDLDEVMTEYRLALLFIPKEGHHETELEICSKISQLREVSSESIQLWIAINRGDSTIEQVKQLLAPGADVNVLFQDTTPLIQAIIKGDENLITELISGGAITNLSTSEQITPLHYSLGYYNELVTIKIVKLLLDNGADPNIPMNDGDTPMHMAHYRANIDAIKLLLRYKANINTPNHAGKTPLHCLLEKQDIAVEDKIKIIEEFLHKYNLTIQDQEDKTVIDYAAEHCLEALSTLLQDIPRNQEDVAQEFLVNAVDVDLALVEPYMLIGYLSSDYNSYVNY